MNDERERQEVRTIEDSCEDVAVDWIRCWHAGDDGLTVGGSGDEDPLAEWRIRGGTETTRYQLAGILLQGRSRRRREADGVARVTLGYVSQEARLNAEIVRPLLLAEYRRTGSGGRRDQAGRQLVWEELRREALEIVAEMREP